jgi:hypothetical protein
MEKEISGGTIPQDQSGWIEEIIRETEHFSQAEIQQDQRGSWLLASVAVLIVAWSSLEIVIIEKNYPVSQRLMIFALVVLVISGLITIINFMPLRGVKLLGDLTGRKYRFEAKLKTRELMTRRFRFDDNWSRKGLEERIYYHYRTHYLRNFRKAYGVLWSSLFLLVGLIIFSIALVSLP